MKIKTTMKGSNKFWLSVLITIVCWVLYLFYPQIISLVNLAIAEPIAYSMVSFSIALFFISMEADYAAIIASVFSPIMWVCALVVLIFMGFYWVYENSIPKFNKWLDNNLTD